MRHYPDLGWDELCVEFGNAYEQRAGYREKENSIYLGQDLVCDRQPVSHEHRIGIDSARVVGFLHIQLGRTGDVLVGYELVCTNM